MKRYIHADTDMATKPGGITYYAVDCRSMYSGYHYLEAFTALRFLLNLPAIVCSLTFLYYR